MPHKANAARRHHIPRPKRRVTNWAEYDAALRQRGSLTVWVTAEAIAGWQAAPRTTPGGPPSYSDLTITTALTLRAVLHLAWRQTEGLIGSRLDRLGLDRPVPDPSPLARRARTVRLPPHPRASGSMVHLLVDSTGVKLCGPGEGRIETQGSKKRRSWKKVQIGLDAVSGRIVAATLTGREVEDAAQVGPWLDRVPSPGASLTGDGADDRSGVYAAGHERHPEAAGVAPPGSDAVLSDTAGPERPRRRRYTAPRQRDRPIQATAQTGRLAWQRDSMDTRRARVEGQRGRWKHVIGAGLRFHTDQAPATAVAIAVDVLNRMLDLGPPTSVRSA